jgi:hypothetical protein
MLVGYVVRRMPRDFFILTLVKTNDQDNALFLTDLPDV